MTLKGVVTTEYHEGILTMLSLFVSQKRLVESFRMRHYIQRPSSYVVDMNCEVDVNENNGPQHMPHDHFQPQNVDWKEDIRDSTPLNDGWYSNLIFVS
jgi:hypothetical protein